MAEVKSSGEVLWSVQRTVDHFSSWSECVVGVKEQEIKKAGSHHEELWIPSIRVWLLFFELWRAFKEFLRRAVAWLEVYFGKSPGSILLNIFEGREPRRRGMPRNYYSCLGCRRGEEKGTGAIQGELMELNHWLNLGIYERGGIKDSFEDLSLSNPRILVLRREIVES